MSNGRDNAKSPRRDHLAPEEKANRFPGSCGGGEKLFLLKPAALPHPCLFHLRFAFFSPSAGSSYLSPDNRERRTAEARGYGPLGVGDRTGKEVTV
jgi:hypothetical protein